MINYYEILGLSNSAGILEIKASFRQLAKLYHPDKNPEGIEHFSKILKAYETLSDPALKASYDYKLSYHHEQQQIKAKRNTPPLKEWKADERELKRRQYYNEHIKKYAKQTSEYVSAAETKKNYNEFKYILFATPLAVLLFLFIMHISTSDKQEAMSTEPVTQQTNIPSEKEDALYIGETVYNSVFGPGNYDTVHNTTLHVNNQSGMELIVCLFRKAEFIRCFYMKEQSTIQVKELPAEALKIYYCSGKDFDRKLFLKEKNIQGAFTRELAFYESIQTHKPDSLHELTVRKGESKDFRIITEQEFFNYAKR